MRTAAALLLCAAALLAPAPAGPVPPSAASGEVRVYVFWAAGCPHCERAIAFLERLQAEDPRIGVQFMEVTRVARHRELLVAAAKALGADDVSVPFIVIGERATIGYLDDASTGAELRALALACLRSRCPDRVTALLEGETPGGARPAATGAGGLPATLRLPLVGEVATRELSLPALTIVLGAVDGFNPCAMWTLVFLIGLLLGMKDRVRMWVLGSAFVLGSALAYFLFMAAWLKLLLLIGFVVWIRIGIGLLAVGGGLYYLREYAVKREALCALAAAGERRRVLERLRELAGEQRFVLALAGILLLAFAVNVVELLCSAGIPAVYTQLLAMSALEPWQHYAYLALYIAVFMADDLVVFVGAMTTLQVSGLTGRYSHYSHLAGGAVLVAIGATMLLRPEWLMIGWRSAG